MDQNFNIDDKFRDAFDSWEADFDPAEMQGDWSQLADKIPGNPAAPGTPGAPSPGAATWGIGKVLSLTGIGAAITAAGIFMYSQLSDVADPASKEANPVVQSETIRPDETAPEESTITLNIGKDDAQAATPEKQLKEQPANERPAATKPAARNNTSSSVIKENTGEAQQQTASGNDQQTHIPFQINNQATEANTRSILPDNRPEVPAIRVRANEKDAVRSIVLFDSVTCAGKGIRAECKGEPGGATIDWGDGTTTPCSRHMYHTYSKEGNYRVRLLGEGNSTEEKDVTVLPIPDATFTSDQKDDKLIRFENKVASSSGYIWLFGDGSMPVNTPNPQHKFPDTGTYVVKLIATNAGLCTDTIAKAVRVSPWVNVPNIFTPNGDNVNDELVISVDDEQSFHVTIVDRSGNVVFESDSKERHWDGRDMKTGKDCPSGTYYCLVQFTVRGGETRSYTRNVSLTR